MSNNHEEGAAQALRDAVYDGDTEKIKSLLAAGADVNARGGQGTTLLMEAAGSSSANVHEAVKLLLAAGAEVGAAIESGYMAGRTALMTAAESLGASALEIVKLLLAAGADVKAKDKDGATALFGAAKSGNANAAEIAKLLLAAGAQVNAASTDGAIFAGETPLTLAAGNGNAGAEIVKLLLAAGADVNASAGKGKTALMSAAEGGGDTLEAAKLLLAAGADVHAKDAEGKAALMYAVENGEASETIQLLLSAGADMGACLEWLRRTADAQEDDEYGRTRTLEALASIYKRGLGVPADESQAAQWQLRACQVNFDEGAIDTLYEMAQEGSAPARESLEVLAEESDYASDCLASL